jgi:hypothetical protein
LVHFFPAEIPPPPQKMLGKIGIVHGKKFLK